MAKPASRLSDLNACPLPGHGTNPTTSGSPDVLFNGLPALRVGDSTACGDAVTEGIGSILINGKPVAFLGSASSGKDSAIRAIFGLDFGETNALTRVVYGLVGLSGVWTAARLGARLGRSPE